MERDRENLKERAKEWRKAVRRFKERSWERVCFSRIGKGHPLDAQVRETAQVFSEKGIRESGDPGADQEPAIQRTPEPVFKKLGTY
jgi:hypothetical protein